MLVRGFYALNDRVTPVRIAVWSVGVNLVLNVTLIWPMAEAGLAVSTSVAAVVQAILLVAIFSRRGGTVPIFVSTKMGLSPSRRLDWRQLALTTAERSPPPHHGRRRARLAAAHAVRQPAWRAN